VTALFNTNAFWTYALCVLLCNDKWRTHKLLSVFLACAGVFAIVYGTRTHDSDDRARRSLLGDALVLTASITYALYEVLYKKYVALPIEDDPSISPVYQPIHANDSTVSTISRSSLASLDLPSHTPISPPVGLYPNFLTSCIGICTILILWIPIPILHLTNVEPFALPPDYKTWLCVAGIAVAGVLYNSGFMVCSYRTSVTSPVSKPVKKVLLGLWGPVLASVGNLLTIVLVVISDFVFGGKSAEVLTKFSLIGCGMIVTAFSVLAFDLFSGMGRR
jgi:drug/metabolite transporter (DMT)-like permease